MTAALLVGLGFVGSFASGLLGVGGAIVLIPLLLYIPPLMGLAGYSMSEAAGMSIVQVLAASVLGALTHRREGFVSRQVALPMAITVGIGAAVGGIASGRVSDAVIKAVFALMAAAASFLMVLPVRHAEESVEVPASFRADLAAAMAGVVGVLSGLVGAGGAFLLAPLMRTVLKLPIRQMIGASLAIVFVSGLMGTIGKAIAQEIPWASALWLVVGALGGAPLGALASHRAPVKLLRWLLAGAIGVTALRMAWELLS